jgi:hypothetical protein
MTTLQFYNGKWKLKDDLYNRTFCNKNIAELIFEKEVFEKTWIESWSVNTTNKRNTRQKNKILISSFSLRHGHWTKIFSMSR